MWWQQDVFYIQVSASENDFCLKRRLLFALMLFDYKIPDSNQVIHQGLTSEMEMCDFFILYWTTGPLVKLNNSCTTNGDFSWKKFGLKNDPFLYSE